MHRRLLFTGAIQENRKTKWLPASLMLKIEAKMVVDRLTMPCAVLLIHSFVS